MSRKTAAASVGRRMAGFMCAFALPATAFSDVTVWTNGNGSGGVTARVKDPNGQVHAWSAVGIGVDQTTSALFGDGVWVTFSWDQGWTINAQGFACKPNTSYGGGGVATLCTVSRVALSASFEPPGTTGSVLHLTGEVSAFGAIDADDAVVHYAVLLANSDVIPQGFLGTAQNLVDRGIIAPGQVLREFTAPNNTLLQVDELVALGVTVDAPDVTLLAWTHGRYVVPAVSEWGLLLMALLTVTAGTVVVMRRRAMVHGRS